MHPTEITVQPQIDASVTDGNENNTSDGGTIITAEKPDTESINHNKDGKFLDADGDKLPEEEEKPNYEVASDATSHRRGVIIESKVRGTVKWYSLRSRYGFIVRNDIGEDNEKPRDVFVHQSAIAKSRRVQPYLRTLSIGEPVQFDIVEGKKGPEASNVTGPNGTKVKGCPHCIFMMISRSKNRKPHSKRTNKKDELSKNDDSSRAEDNETTRVVNKKSLEKKDISNPVDNPGDNSAEKADSFYNTRSQQRKAGRRRIPRGNGDNNKSEPRQKAERPRRQKRNKREGSTKRSKELKFPEGGPITTGSSAGTDNHVTEAVKAKGRSSEPELQVMHTDERKDSGFEVVGNVTTSLQEMNVAELQDSVISGMKTLSIS